MSGQQFRLPTQKSDRANAVREWMVGALIVGGVIGLVVPAWANDMPLPTNSTDADSAVDKMETNSASVDAHIKSSNDIHDEAAGESSSRTTLDIKTNLPAEIKVNGEEIPIPADGHVQETIEGDGSNSSINLDVNGQASSSTDGELDVRLRQRTSVDFESETKMSTR